MVDRMREEAGRFEADLAEGRLPGIDLDLGSDSQISGGDDLANYDEENLYGNDVLVGSDDDDEEDDLDDELDEVDLEELDEARDS